MALKIYFQNILSWFYEGEKVFIYQQWKIFGNVFLETLTKNHQSTQIHLFASIHGRSGEQFNNNLFIQTGFIHDIYYIHFKLSACLAYAKFMVEKLWWEVRSDTINKYNFHWNIKASSVMNLIILFLFYSLIGHIITCWFTARLNVSRRPWWIRLGKARLVDV